MSAIRVIPLLISERERIIKHARAFVSENASRHGHHFAQQRLGFFLSALRSLRGVTRIAQRLAGFSEGLSMFFAIELQTSRVYVSLHSIGLFKPSKD